MTEILEEVNSHRTALGEIVDVATNSLDVADHNIDNILHLICQRKWENEVIEKKGKQNAVGWVFSNNKHCLSLEPDPALIGAEYDQDSEDEPVSQKHIDRFTSLIFVDPNKEGHSLDRWSKAKDQATKPDQTPVFLVWWQEPQK